MYRKIKRREIELRIIYAGMNEKVSKDFPYEKNDSR